MAHVRVKNVKSEVLSDQWYTLNKITFDYQLKNGDWVTQIRESYNRGNGACILLYNRKKKTIILIRQFRMPTYLSGNEEGFLIEVCAGLLDDDHPDDCIKKEAEEETGYRITKVQKVLEAYSSPGAVTEKMYFYIAEYSDDMKVSVGGGLAIENEDIEVLEIPFKEAVDMMNNGQIKDLKTIVLLQHAQLRDLL